MIAYINNKLIVRPGGQKVERYFAHFSYMTVFC